MVSAHRRPFRSWIADVLCGLVSYGATAWIWEGRRAPDLWSSLPKEIATFAGCYALLRVLLLLWGRARAQSKRVRVAERAAQDVARRTAPPAPTPPKPQDPAAPRV